MTDGMPGGGQQEPLDTRTSGFLTMGSPRQAGSLWSSDFIPSEQAG